MGELVSEMTPRVALLNYHLSNHTRSLNVSRNEHENNGGIAGGHAGVAWRYDSSYPTGEAGGAADDIVGHGYAAEGNGESNSAGGRGDACRQILLRSNQWRIQRHEDVCLGGQACGRSELRAF